MTGPATIPPIDATEARGSREASRASGAAEAAETAAVARDGAGPTGVMVAVHTRAGVHRWRGAADALPFDRSPGSPWLLVPPAVRAGFDAVCEAGTALADTPFGAPTLGVKCGCNAAFIVRRRDPESEESTVWITTARGCAPPRSGRIERAMLRPLVRGETVALGAAARADGGGGGAGPVADTGTAGLAAGGEWIIWTAREVDGTQEPIDELPPHAARWFAPWRHRLAARADTRGRAPWWALFRTEGASSATPRLVWADLARRPRAIVLAAGDPTVPLNSCYVLRTSDLRDAEGLRGLLTSPLAAAWLAVIAEPARGLHRRYLGWTVGLLPVPHDWERARALLAQVAQARTAGAPLGPVREAAIAARAYRLPLARVRALLAWTTC